MKSVKYIPFSHIHQKIKKEILKEFERFYDDQKYILGPGLEKFEKKYAEFNGTQYAIGVGNGHDALLIILKCLEIGPGAEVIVPAHTFIATALSAVNAGARPVLVDVDNYSFNINPSLIEDKITERTKAIVPVHIYGNPADLMPIQTIADKHNIHLIEDNAQAHGASIKDQQFLSYQKPRNSG